MPEGLTGREPSDSNSPQSSRTVRLASSLETPLQPGTMRRLLPPLSFRAVNRKGLPGYDPGLQRHHILPLQLVARHCFGAMFDGISRAGIGFDDFRRNGLLLPASEVTARLMGLPLHRGPHRDYNLLVIDRVGQIEARWALSRRGDPDKAGLEALFRLKLLQEALRKRILSPRGTRLALNRRDPAFAIEPDFSELDAMADSLWGDVTVAQAVNGEVRLDRSDNAWRYSVSSLSTRAPTGSTLVTAPIPCPEPQMSFHAFAPVLPPEPKSILLGSLSGRLSGSRPA